MFKNYLKIAWRGLLKQKGYTALNIGGLAVGMAATMLIGMWVYNELSYNSEFENYDSIVQVMQSQTFADEINTGKNQPMQLAPVLRNEYGDYFRHIVTSSFIQDELLSVKEHKVSRPGNFMEPGIAEMLSLKMLKGTRNALKDPTSLLISESTAKVLFGDVDPMGQNVKIGTKMQAQVAGVYSDLPQNSDFAELSFIAPWELLNKTANFEERLGWGNNWFQVVAQLEHGENWANVSSLIADAKYNKIKNEGGAGAGNRKPIIHLHPMNKWHLYSKFENGINTGGAINRVWLFGIIGLFILLLACINFMNLSTAKSVKRAKEVGIRKTIGSVRTQLISQFLSESFLVVGLSFVLSLILVLMAQPFFNGLTNKVISTPWRQPLFWVSCFIFIVFTALISGSYPAFYLSSFKPVKVLKGKIDGGQGASRLRKTLVVFQFSISVALIFGTLTIFKQLEHVKNRPIGYDREQLLYVPINTSEIITHFETVRNELLGSNEIKEVAASDVLNTGAFTTNSGFDWKGKDPSMSEEFYTLRATYGYGDMVNWKIKEGRDFSREFKGDSTAFIVNETAVKYMGLENPVGEFVKWGNNGTFKIVGVVKDMVTQSPYDEVPPMLFTLHYGRFLNYVNIKVSEEGSTHEALAHIEKVFKKHDPESLFSYNFLDEQYARNFLSEERTGRLVSFFAGLAILISCLGIFGLSAFVAEQRTKEIGVRKVLGASVYSLWQLLSKEFVLMVIISCCVAIPIGNYYMNGWMERYAYRTEIGWGIFVVSVFGALAITILTISFQAIRAALSNPVESLRTE